MNAIDLSVKAPRRPRAELAGVIFLPRSIDKVRALLPGGNPGPYTFDGLTKMMLEQLGISKETFVDAVAQATSDEDVAAFVRSNTTPANITAWNDFISKRKPRNGDRAAAEEFYPWLKDRPDLIVTLDVLEEDDKQYFASK